MRRKILISWLFSMLVIFVSCEKHNELKINDEVVLKRCTIQLFQKDKFATNFGSIDFVYTGDTIKRNVDLDSKDLLAQLNNELKNFDTLDVNNKTVLYLKSLFLANFVHAAFSHQFLGTELGLANDSLIRSNWEDYSLEEQFDFGNKNEVAFSCWTRTKFYLQLTHMLLDLKGRDTSIENVHTYPILNIYGSEYLVDPSDPAVFISSTTNKIIKFNELKRSSDVVIYKLNYNFGASHFIFSNSFMNRIQPEGNNLKDQILGYLALNQELVLNKVPACFNPHYKKRWEISYLDGKNNALAVSLFGRNLGTFLTPQNFKETYFGANCNSLN